MEMSHWKLNRLWDFIKAKRCRSILEFGTGQSSQILSIMLDEGLVDALVTVDHLAAYQARWRLPSSVYQIIVPMSGCCYDLSHLKEQLPEGFEADLCLVDGPPAYKRGTHLARNIDLDALPLTPDVYVVLDDAERPGEQAVIKNWESQGWEIQETWAQQRTRSLMKVLKKRG